MLLKINKRTRTILLTKCKSFVMTLEIFSLHSNFDYKIKVCNFLLKKQDYRLMIYYIWHTIISKE